VKNLILILICILAAAKFSLWQTGGFALAKMVTSSSPYHLAPSSSPLHFLGAGKQFYAFETPDHRHVFKFVKFSRRSPLPWLANLHLPAPFEAWKTRWLATREKRLFQVKQSGHLALTLIPSQTGLLPIPTLSSPLTLIDKLGIHHTIDPSSTLFFLQEKATPFIDYFDEHPLDAHTLIDSYISTVASQCSQNLCNLDPLIERNYGVANSRVIILDIGSFSPRTLTPVQRTRQIFLELLPLRAWLQNCHPEHLFYFDTSLKKTLSVD
jgi:hypothetical protein